METTTIKAKQAKVGMVLSLPNLTAVIKEVEKINAQSVKIHYGTDSQIFQPNDQITVL